MLGAINRTGRALTDSFHQMVAPADGLSDERIVLSVVQRLPTGRAEQRLFGVLASALGTTGSCHHLSSFLIVERAIDYKLGARGLRSICEAIMTDAMYEMPGSSERPTELRITLSYAREKFDRSRMSQLKVA